MASSTKKAATETTQNATSFPSFANAPITTVTVLTLSKLDFPTNGERSVKSVTYS